MDYSFRFPHSIAYAMFKMENAKNFIDRPRMGGSDSVPLEIQYTGQKRKSQKVTGVLGLSKI